MRLIGVVTVARSDYGIYLPVLRSILADPQLQLHLIVGGMHLSPEFGLTVCAIEQDGFVIGDRVEMLLSSDTPEGIAKSMGMGMIGFARLEYYNRSSVAGHQHLNWNHLLALHARFDPQGIGDVFRDRQTGSGVML